MVDASERVSAGVAALILGVTPMTLARCAKRGDVPFTLSGKFRRYAIGDLLALKAQRDARRGRSRGAPTLAERVQRQTEAAHA